VKIILTIEKSPSDGLLWGSANYSGNLITCYASTVELLEKEMRIHLLNFEGLASDSMEFVRQLI